MFVQIPFVFILCWVYQNNYISITVRRSLQWIHRYLSKEGINSWCRRCHRNGYTVTSCRTPTQWKTFESPSTRQKVPRVLLAGRNHVKFMVSSISTTFHPEKIFVFLNLLNSALYSLTYPTTPKRHRYLEIVTPYWTPDICGSHSWSHVCTWIFFVCYYLSSSYLPHSTLPAHRDVHCTLSISFQEKRWKLPKRIYNNSNVSYTLCIHSWRTERKDRKTTQNNN